MVFSEPIFQIFLGISQRQDAPQKILQTLITLPKRAWMEHKLSFQATINI